MKKTIDGKEYNTDTSTLIASCVIDDVDSVGCIRQTLYRKKNKKFFLVEDTDFDLIIYPMSPDNAKAWARRYMSQASFSKVFGNAYEESYLVTLSTTDREYLERFADSIGLNFCLNDVIHSVIQGHRENNTLS